MMRIELVASQADRAGRYAVRFDDGTSMRLYRQTIEDFGLYSGKELEEAEYTKLNIAAGQMSAKMRAVRIVSASSISKRDLEYRLVQKGENEEDARHAVAWMAEMDLLDDRKTAQQIITRCIAKGYGINRAKQALFEKRIPKCYWEEVLEDYPDQIEPITAFLYNHLHNTKDQKQIRKAVDALMRRGHTYSSIRTAMQQMALDEVFSEE